MYFISAGLAPSKRKIGIPTVKHYLRSPPKYHSSSGRSGSEARCSFFQNRTFSALQPPPPPALFFIYTVPPSSIASLQNNPPSCHPLCLCCSTSEDISLYIACPPSVSLSWNWQSSDSQWRPLTLLFLRSLHLLSSRPPLSLPALTLWVLLLYTPSIALNCWNTSLVTFDAHNPSFSFPNSHSSLLILLRCPKWAMKISLFHFCDLNRCGKTPGCV